MGWLCPGGGAVLRHRPTDVTVGSKSMIITIWIMSSSNIDMIDNVANLQSMNFCPCYERERGGTKYQCSPGQIPNTNALRYISQSERRLLRCGMNWVSYVEVGKPSAAAH